MKKNVTPLLTHWSYVFLALTHWFVFYRAYAQTRYPRLLVSTLCYGTYFMCVFPIQHKLHVKYQNHYTDTEMLSFRRCFHHWLAVAAKKVVKMTTFTFNFMERRNNHSYLTDRDLCSYWSRRSVLQNRKVAIVNVTGLCLNGEFSTQGPVCRKCHTYILSSSIFFRI